jgi:hypothetical protein
MKADRTNFLSLGPMFAGKTNPLVVIAWGHGGKQGSMPVFHVRGQRLTPADFNALALEAKGMESKWVLMFRGSGEFASRIAGEGRQILSSESETMFASDPIGMPVLIKLARTKPQASFLELSEEFGRGTAAWYTERNLARTEEPTLWIDKEKPRLLAATAPEANSFASVKAEEPGESTSKKATTPEPLGGDLPPAWKEIARADAKKYPEADGVLLRRRVNYTLGSNPAITSEQEEFMQILTPEGKRYGDFDISYSPPFEDINFLDCEVLSPDGKLTRLDPDAIREARDEAVGDYQAGRRKFFSLPGVVPGAILRVRYRTEWKTFPLPHVSLEIPVGQDAAVIDSTLQVSVPKDAPFHFAFDHLSIVGESFPAADPAIKQSEYGTAYSWHFENLPTHEHELLAPPRQNPRLLLSTFADWKTFADWYSRISKLADDITPEIKAKAEELSRGARNDRDKVLALYNYVTSLRYVAIPLGVNSFRPHAASRVLENQFGDCKDKANLFNTLLRSLNIDGLHAQLVLVPRFSQAHDAIPGLSFNHAISRVKLGDEVLWMDTTDDVCRFGMLPPGDSGRKVLVIGEQTERLTQLPLPDAKEHRLQVHAEVDCTTTNSALPATLHATAIGYPDYELRETAREAKEHRTSLPLLAARFRPVAGSFALEKQSASSVAALDEDFTWNAEGSFIGISDPAIQEPKNPTGVTIRAPFWLPKEWDLALHHRQTMLFLSQGYPLTLEEELEFSLPAKLQVVALPSPAMNKARPLNWVVEWTKGEGKLKARLEATLARGELSLSETAAFQRQLRTLLTALAEGVPLIESR